MADSQLETEQEDELRDLAQQDAEELRAFLVKRRWFENKLKVLEGSDAIYPFLHPRMNPTVESKSQPFDREGASSSQWQLPDVNQVNAWQRERDALEEEVFEFDGGDLARIKVKTRAVTLLPLTPPSTHLVSITLDLIVLVDRLLKLLRYRASLLELVYTRLQWDRIRGNIMEETRKIREEVDSIVKDKAHWTPLQQHTPLTIGEKEGDLSGSDASSSSANVLQKGMPYTGADVIPQTPRPRQTLLSGSPSLDSQSPRHMPASLSPRTQSGSFSPYRSSSTPKRSLHIPILHSQVVNLRIRHRNVASTQVTRSSALLDRMIDLAGPLKGLGDVTGPGQDTAEQSGAVPDQLLDVQDELEAEVVEIGERVRWCEELEQQWKLSETHYIACSEAKSEVQAFRSELCQALDEPATSEHHRHLADILRSAQLHLPPPLDHAFLRPSHPAYPETLEHTARVVETLTTARHEAVGEISEARKGLEWYERLALDRERLLDKQKELSNASQILKAGIVDLSEGLESCPRPRMDEEAIFDTDLGPWLSALPSQLQRVESYLNLAQTASQAVVLALARYRNSRKSTPPTFDIAIVKKIYDDEVLDQADQETDEVSEELVQAAGAINIARQDSEIIPLAQSIHGAANNISTTSTALLDRVLIATRGAAWPSNHDNRPDVDELHSQIRHLDRRIKEEVAKPLATLHDLLSAHDRQLPYLRARLESIGSELLERHSNLNKAIDVMKNIIRQTEAVQEVEGQADRLVKKISVVQDEVERLRLDSTVVESSATDPLSDRIDHLATEYSSWEASIAARVPLLASESGFDDTTGRSSSANDLRSTTTSAAIAPITPPPSAPSTPVDNQAESTPMPFTTAIDLVTVDRNVKATVNGYTVRVASGISHARSTLHDVLFESWADQCYPASDTFDKSLSEWNVIRQGFHSQIAGLQHKVATNPTSTNAAKATVQAIEVLHGVISAKTAACEADLKGSLDAFARLVSSKPTRFDSACNKAVEWDAAVLAAQEVAAGALSEVAHVRNAVDELLAAAKTRLENNRGLSSAPPSPMPASDDVYVQSSSSSLRLHREQPPQSNGLMNDGVLVRIQHLGKELDGLRIHKIVAPTSADIEATPALRRLPTVDTAKIIQDGLEVVHAKVQTFALTARHPAESELNSLKSAVDAQREMLPRLHQLALVEEVVKTCDSAFSTLLEMIDAPGDEQVQALSTARDQAGRTMEKMEEDAEDVRSDQRVAMEIRRVIRAWEELRALVDERLHLHPERNVNLHEEDEQDDARSYMTTNTTRPNSVISTSTRAPSVTSTTISRLPRLRESVRLTNKRAVSNPHATRRMVDSPSTTMFSPSRIPRNRSASDTPSRSRLTSMRSTTTATPTSRQNEDHSVSLVNPPSQSHTTPRDRTTSIPRPVRMVTPSRGSSAQNQDHALSLSKNGLAPRSRRSSRLPSLTDTRKKKKTYVSDPKSKLDVAVGTIVNKLDVDVPIVPVGLGSANDWKDQSGQYWIGAEGRAKLCFCRILRSYTVMVRVGGGWLELSKFLLDHFADAMTSWQTPLDALDHPALPLPTEGHTPVPAPIISTSLAAANANAARGGMAMAPSSSNSSISSILSTSTSTTRPRTPTRKPLAQPETNASPGPQPFVPVSHTSALTPNRPRASLSPFPRTPGSGRASLAQADSPSTPLTAGAAGAGAGGGSPLVALQFIRRASESPSARRKEKERFVGRRSILGKEREKEKEKNTFGNGGTEDENDE